MEADRALSQEEIDALLAAIPDHGGVAAPMDMAEGQDSVRKYDFRAPDRFSKEQVRTLQMIYSAFGRHFSGSLSAALRYSAQVPFVHIEQSTFGDFSETLPESTITMVVTMEPRLGDGDFGLIAGGDVLIEGDRIIAVGKELDGAGAVIVDATGKILMPGFVDVHNHLWQSLIRGCGTDKDLNGWLGACP